MPQMGFLDFGQAPRLQKGADGFEILHCGVLRPYLSYKIIFSKNEVHN